MATTIQNVHMYPVVGIDHIAIWFVLWHLLYGNGNTSVSVSSDGIQHFSDGRPDKSAVFGESNCRILFWPFQWLLLVNPKEDSKDMVSKMRSHFMYAI